MIAPPPSARKEGRFREPPPTPPGYTALPAADFGEAAAAHAGRKPPDYSVALQRSRMVARSCDSPLPPSLPPRGPCSRLPRFRSQGAAADQPDDDPEEVVVVEEEGESLSPKLTPVRRPVAYAPETTRP